MQTLQINPKDFVETEEGLLFAVVMPTLEQGKVLCVLRYINQGGYWQKLATQQANVYLKQHHPHYLYHSPVLDAHLHAVPLEHIAIHHQPRQRLQQLLQSKSQDLTENDTHQLCNILQQNGVDTTQLGVTGSLLIGAQHPDSDIDIVCYQKPQFQQCRQTIARLMATGQLQALSEQDWQEAYRRRDCALDYVVYVWHEQRKYNKAMVNGRKFDLSLVTTPEAHAVPEHYHKHGPLTLQCTVLDDSRAFDYPAEFSVDHQTVSYIVSYTATYTGQAQQGETIEAAGQLEQDGQGVMRLVIGSSREAHGEYIRVIHA